MDYVTKPFDTRESLARIEVHLRPSLPDPTRFDLRFINAGSCFAAGLCFLIRASS